MFKKIKQFFGLKTRHKILPAEERRTESDNSVEESEDKVDIPGSVPPELLYEIVAYLSPRDWSSMSNCCRLWRCKMEPFWRRKCAAENYFESEDNLNSKLYRKFIAKYSQWQGLYLYHSQLENCWITGYAKEIHVDYKTHSFTPSNELSYFSGDIFIAVNNKEKIISVIDSTTGLVKEFFLLRGFKSTYLNIRQVGKFENRLIAVSETKTFARVHIKVWNIETGMSLTEFDLEMDKILKVVIYKNLVSVITPANMAHIINIQERKLDYQRNCVRSIFHFSDKIAMGTDVGTVVIINLDYMELMEITCFESARSIDDVQVNGKYLIGLSQNENTEDILACIWDLDKKIKLYEVDRLLKDELTIYPNQNRLVYSLREYKNNSYEKYTKWCCLDTGDCIFKMGLYSVISSADDLVIMHEDLENYAKHQRLFKLRSIQSGNVIGQLSLPEDHYTWIHRVWKTKTGLAFLKECTYRYPTIHILNFESTMEI